MGMTTIHLFYLPTLSRQVLPEKWRKTGLFPAEKAFGYPFHRIRRGFLPREFPLFFLMSSRCLRDSWIERNY